MEWHIEAGMRAIIIEAPLALQQAGINIPQEHLAICHDQGIPTEGNCAGKTDHQVLDTSGCKNKETPMDTWGSLVSPPGLSSLPAQHRLFRRARQPKV